MVTSIVAANKNCITDRYRSTPRRKTLREGKRFKRIFLNSKDRVTDFCVSGMSGRSVLVGDVRGRVGACVTQELGFCVVVWKQQHGSNSVRTEKQPPAAAPAPAPAHTVPPLRRSLVALGRSSPRRSSAPTVSRMAMRRLDILVDTTPKLTADPARNLEATVNPALAPRRERNGERRRAVVDRRPRDPCAGTIVVLLGASVTGKIKDAARVSDASLLLFFVDTLVTIVIPLERFSPSRTTERFTCDSDACEAAPGVTKFPRRRVPEHTRSQGLFQRVTKDIGEAFIGTRVEHAEYRLPVSLSSHSRAAISRRRRRHASLPHTHPELAAAAVRMREDQLVRAVHLSLHNSTAESVLLLISARAPAPA